MQPRQQNLNVSLSLPLLLYPLTETAVINPASFCRISSASSFRCSRKSKKRLKLKKRLHRLATKPDPFFPKSSPTPLLIPQNPCIQTELQALDAVVSDLESSIESGLKLLDTQIISSLLETCFRLQSVEHGIRIRRLIPESLLRKNVGIASKLLRLYAANGRIENAHQVFDEMPDRDGSAFPWNSLISGYAELGLYEDAIALYFQMEEEGVRPDQFTFPRVLKACAGMRSVQIGEAVHRHIVHHGFGGDVYVLNSLVDMYAKCGDIVKARKVFDNIACRDSVTWNSMLTGYIHHGLLFEALGTFCRMLEDGYEPDPIAISAILTSVSFSKLGAQIHGWVLRRGRQWNLSIVNALIAAYSSRGKSHRARWLFDQMPERDVVSWNSIISAHTKDYRALAYFWQMESAGSLPDSITFVSLLSACAYLGLVKYGEELFRLMREKYGIRPTMEHYACLVNLFGRAGLVVKAYDIVTKTMDMEAGPTVWGALLHACYLHGNVNIGEVAAEMLFELEPDNEHNFELLMRIYAIAGRTDEAERVRKMKMDRGLDYVD